MLRSRAVDADVIVIGAGAAVGRMRIAEPMTTATDYGLAALAVWLAVRLWHQSRAAGARLWCWAFLATALAATAGGSWHGFAPRLSPFASVGLWLVTYAAIGLANLLMLAGAFAAFLPRSARPWLNAALVLRFLAYVAFLVWWREFRYVVYDYGLTLALLLVLGLLAVARRQPSGAWIVAAVAVSLAGALVQRSGVALHAQFNHNDLFHVVQMAGLWLFSRAGRVLPKR